MTLFATTSNLRQVQLNHAALRARSVASMTGSAVLEGAVAAYRATDARGLDTLPAGVLLTAAQRDTLQVCADRDSSHQCPASREGCCRPLHATD